jgi:hypothetical protein
MPKNLWSDDGPRREEQSREVWRRWLAMNRVQLAASYYVYSRGDLLAGSPSRVALSFGGIPRMLECVECRFVLFTPAVRKPLDRFESHE